jgi:hypothetical protein
MRTKADIELVSDSGLFCSIFVLFLNTASTAGTIFGADQGSRWLIRLRRNGDDFKTKKERFGTERSPILRSFLLA